MAETARGVPYFDLSDPADAEASSLELATFIDAFGIGAPDRTTVQRDADPAWVGKLIYNKTVGKYQMCIGVGPPSVWTNEILGSIYLLTSQRGAPDGVASLDADTRLPAAQLPSLLTSDNIKRGAGAPEGSIAAGPGTVYQRTDVGEVYVKLAGSGNTGWVEVGRSPHLFDGFVGDAESITAATPLWRSNSSALGANPDQVQMPVVMSRAGSVTGITLASEGARTAGSMTVEVYKNGVATGLTAVLDATNTQYVVTTQALGLDTFVAGDRLDVRATNAAWAPNARIEAAIEVRFT